MLPFHSHPTPCTRDTLVGCCARSQHQVLLVGHRRNRTIVNSHYLDNLFTYLFAQRRGWFHKLRVVRFHNMGDHYWPLREGRGSRIRLTILSSELSMLSGCVLTNVLLVLTSCSSRPHAVNLFVLLDKHLSCPLLDDFSIRFYDCKLISHHLELLQEFYLLPT